MSSFYADYSEQGAPAYAPEMLLGIIVYGYSTGVFSSRQMEKATCESLPFIYIAGGLHPDHDTINTFRGRFLTEIEEIFVQVLLMAQATGLLQLGNISLDGSKIHADASKSQALSYARALELEAYLGKEVAALMALAADCEQGKWPEGFDPEHEIRLRQEHLAGLDQAKAVLEERAKVRYAEEMAVYEAKMAERRAKTERTVDAIAPQLGRPSTAALDNGYFSADNIAGLLSRGITPYIATGREPHHASWTDFFEANPQPPADASAKVKMAYQLKTEVGHAIYRLRKSTVEPVIGIIKEVLGFRQFSLRGQVKAAGEWMLVCLAFNLKRLHVLGL